MFLLLFYWSCPRFRPLFFFGRILPQKKTWTGWSRFCFFSAKWGVKPTDFFENLIFGLEIKSFPLLVFTWSQGFKKQARPPPTVTLKSLWVIREQDPQSGEGKKQKLSPDKRRRRSKRKTQHIKNPGQTHVHQPNNKLKSKLFVAGGCQVHGSQHWAPAASRCTSPLTCGLCYLN